MREETRQTVRQLLATGGIGGGVTFYNLSVHDVLALAVGAVTVLAMIPVALVRWRDLLNGKKVDTSPPFQKKDDKR